MRPRNTKHGSVILDKQRNRPELIANIERASVLIEKATEQLRIFINSELATGDALLEVASHDENAEKVARYRLLARLAYDTVTRLLPRTNVPEKESKRFRKQLGELRLKLESLGERF